jgi:hypothetical protein
LIRITSPTKSTSSTSSGTSNDGPKSSEMRGPTELVAWCEFLISKFKHQPTPFCANHFWRWRFTCFKTFSCMQSAKRDLYTDDRDLTGQLLRHVEKCSGYIFLFLFIYALIWMFLHCWAAHNKFQAMIFTIDNNRDTFNSLENGNIIHFAWITRNVFHEGPRLWSDEHTSALSV